jgi:hypothetical protein
MFIADFFYYKYFFNLFSGKIMKTKPKVKHSNRKTFYKLLDSFEEKDFYAVKNFAEFIKTKNGKETLEEILEKAEYDSEELNEKTIKEIEKAKAEFREGKTYSSEHI